jgi:hypothetical protein
MSILWFTTAEGTTGVKLVLKKNKEGLEEKEAYDDELDYCEEKEGTGQSL